MGVVHMHRYPAVKIFQGAVSFFMGPADTLQPGGNKKILLLQAQRLPLAAGVIRVEQPADRLQSVLVLDDAAVAAGSAAASFQIADHRLGAPEAQRVHGAVLIAHHRQIVGDRQHGLVIFVVKDQPVPGLLGPHPAPESDLNRFIGAPRLPDITAAKPVFGHLDLFTAGDNLLEKAVAVAYAAAVSGQAQGGQGIEKTGRQPAQTAVAQPCVGLLGEGCVKIQAQLIKALTTKR